MGFALDNFAEAILTYSWGLLIIGMILTMLGLFGYFDSVQRVPDSCEISAGFECLTLEATNNSWLHIVIRNKLNQSFVLENVRVLTLNPLCGGIKNMTANLQFFPAEFSAYDISRVSMQCSTPWSDLDQLKGEIVFSLLNSTGRVHNISISLQTRVRG